MIWFLNLKHEFFKMIILLSSQHKIWCRVRTYGVVIRFLAMWLDFCQCYTTFSNVIRLLPIGQNFKWRDMTLNVTIRLSTTCHETFGDMIRLLAKWYNFWQHKTIFSYISRHGNVMRFFATWHKFLLHVISFDNVTGFLLTWVDFWTWDNTFVEVIILLTS